MTSQLDLELAHIAASAQPVAERGQAMVDRLRELVPFDSAWLAFAHPQRAGYSSLASVDLDEGIRTYFCGPRNQHDIEVTGADRPRPPVSPSDLPYPSDELPTWSECLIPAGYHEALAVGLFGEGGRHVGFLALLSGSRRPPPTVVRQRLQHVVPTLARGIDPMGSLVVAARVVQTACAGTVLCADGVTEPLPGLDGDALLDGGSAVVAIARARIGDGQVYTSFLWPRGGRHAPGGHVRVTVLAATHDVPPCLLGTVILSPATDLRGLTARELEVLGLVVDGRSNQQIAHALFVAPRTIATHLEHILHKLGAPTRTSAAVRGEREGLYVPPLPSPGRG